VCSTFRWTGCLLAFFPPFRLGSLTSRRGDGTRRVAVSQRGGRKCSRDGSCSILDSRWLSNADFACHQLVLDVDLDFEGVEVGTTRAIAHDKGDDGGRGRPVETATGTSFSLSCADSLSTDGTRDAVSRAEYPRPSIITLERHVRRAGAAKWRPRSGTARSAYGVRAKNP